MRLHNKLTSQTQPKLNSQRAPSLQSERGQMTLEFVLLAIAFASAALFVGNYMRAHKFMQVFTVGPWAYIQGMTQSGVWAPPAQAKDVHPNRLRRLGTVNGEPKS